FMVRIATPSVFSTSTKSGMPGLREWPPSWGGGSIPEAKEAHMDYGLFTMPSHPPERKLFDGHQWDLQTLRWADELGFSEAWIGEHHTSPWEPHPSPDLLVAQALMQTK